MIVRLPRCRVSEMLQSSNHEELSASIDEILFIMKCRNAKNAADLTNQAKNQVDIGSDRMKAMMIAVENIEKSSNEIAKIIKVIIYRILTNILALNVA